MAPDYDKKVPEFEKKVPELEKVPESDKKYLKKAGRHIGRNVVQITMKMRTIVQIIQIMLDIYIHLLYLSTSLCCFTYLLILIGVLLWVWIRLLLGMSCLVPLLSF